MDPCLRRGLRKTGAGSYRLQPCTIQTIIPGLPLASLQFPWTLSVLRAAARGRPIFYVYILASQTNGTLYTGHTDDIAKRVWAHKEGLGSIFTKKYGVTRLVWYEPHQTRDSAKTREYQIKKWKRTWKIRLIEETNPHWYDLYLELNR